MKRTVGVLLTLLLACPHAHAADAGALQVAVAAPDPAFAGGSVAFQILAVNTGSETWLEGTYSWEAEVYDLQKGYVAKTERQLPKGDIAPGGIASVVLPFSIPENLVGRKYFRAFLTRGGRRLVESDYIPFSIVEKPFSAAPPPSTIVEVERPPEYRAGGNVSFQYKYIDGHNEGATTINAVGKSGYSSFLANIYLLHNVRPKQHIIDPYILVINYYAPWGVLNAGDISPAYSPLSLYGQGMRGLQLDQKRENRGWTANWSLVGGRVFPAQSGGPGTDGRYERWIYGARFGADLPWGVKMGADYVLGQDNATSLSSDPANPKFRGPTARPQRNPLYGLNAAWEPIDGLKVSGDFQQSQISTDTEAGVRPLSDSAWRVETSWAQTRYSIKAGVQRTGPKFASFGSPTAIPDRFTIDGGFNLFPLRWWTLYATLSRFEDNLAKDPAKTTTEQQAWTLGNSFNLKTGTSLNLAYSLNTVEGKPVTVLSNETGSLLLSVNQSIGAQALSASLQTSQFKDKTKTSHDLDSQTIGLRANGRVGESLTGTFGTTLSETKDKVDGSKRESQTLSASVEFPILRDTLTDQIWGTLSETQSPAIAPATAADKSSTMTLNTELVWQYAKDLSYSLGAGYSATTHSDGVTADQKELTASLRVNWAFDVASRPPGK